MAISYADIQKAADKKLEDVVFTVPTEDGEGTEDLRFQHLMRLDKEVRGAYAGLFKPTTYRGKEFKDMDGIDVQVYVLKRVFSMLAKEPRDFERLEAVVSASCEARGIPELTDWKELLSSYGAEVEEGEA